MSLKHFEILLIREVYFQIQRSITHPVALKVLIAETNISAPTFIKYYKQLYGQTPAQHRIALTMKYADKQLVQGESVKNIAKELGYSTVQNFSRVYKLAKGYPPSKHVQT